MKNSTTNPLISHRLPISRALFLACLLGTIALSCTAWAEIEHSTLSPHFEVVEQSLSGVTLRMRLPREKGKTARRERFLVAVPPGPPPRVRFLEFSYAAWGKEGLQSATGPIDLEANPKRLNEVAGSGSIVKRNALGLLRDVRLESVEVLPYHTARGKRDVDLHQIYDLTFRLEFKNEATPAPPEPDFARGFPSGYRDIFREILVNSEAIPLGLSPDESKEDQSGEPPYFDAVSLKLRTTEEGFYFLPATRLAALGQEQILPEQLALHHRRKEVPLAILRRTAEGYRPDTEPDRPLAAEDGVLFFAPLSESPYSPESVFYLSLTGGSLRCQGAQRLESNSGVQPATSALQLLHVEENHSLWKKQHKTKDKTQHEYWIWREVDTERPFSHRFELPGPLDSGGASGAIRLKVVMLPEVSPRHFKLQGYTARIADTTYPAEQLKPTPLQGSTVRTTLEVEVPIDALDPERPALDFTIKASASDDGRSVKGFSIDAFDLEYERKLRLQPEGLVFRPRAADQSWQIELPPELSGQPFLAIGRSSRGQLFHFPVREVEGALVVERSAAAGDSNLVELSLIPASRMAHSLDAELSPPNALHRSARRADVIFITHPMFLDALEPLVELRRRQGYLLELVSTFDIYKYFGDGSLNPEDIKRFLKYAYEHWGPARPTGVVLVGDARWDYWGYLNLDVPNLVPTYH